MNEIDFERANLLMDVIAKVTNIAPTNQAILGEAQMELRAIQEAAQENANERAEERRQEEAKRSEAEGLRLRAEHQQPSQDEVAEDEGDEEPAITRRT